MPSDEDTAKANLDPKSNLCGSSCPGKHTDPNHQEKDAKQKLNYSSYTSFQLIWILVRRCVVITDKYSGAVTALSTLVIAMLTGFIWHEASRQYGVLNGQLSAMKDADKTTRDSFQLVQRAFINISELKQEYEVGEDGIVKNIKLTPIIKNSGSTAARKVKIRIVSPMNYWMLTTSVENRQLANYISFKVHAPPDPELIPSNAEINPALIELSNLSIGPGGSLSASDLTINIPANAGMLAQSDKIGRFLYGTVSFDDIFRVNHTSKFCFAIDSVNISDKKETQRQSLCRHWNCTDDDCKEDSVLYNDDIKNALVENSRKEQYEDWARKEGYLPPK